MDLTTAVTLTRRWETRLRVAAVRVSSKRDYASKLEKLGLSDKSEAFADIYEAAGRKAVKEAIVSDDWEVEDTGDELEEEGSFVTEILPPNRDPQDAADVTVSFTVTTPEWVDVVVVGDIDISNLMDRASKDKKAVSSLLKDAKCREHILSLCLEAAADEMRDRAIPQTEVTAFAEAEAGDAHVEIEEFDSSDAAEFWELTYKAGDLTTAPKATINAKGELSVGVMCRLTVTVKADQDYANSKYQPGWLRRRNRGRDYDDERNDDRY